MTTRNHSAAERAASVVDGSTAREVLREPTPPLLWAVLDRIDELRFQDPPAAYQVADAALAALGRLPLEQRRRELVFALWSAYGSTCRATARFSAAERALLTAARIACPGDLRRRAEVAERLAYVRADQGREVETRTLVRFFLGQARLGERVNLGQRLTAASSIMTRFRDYGTVAELAKEALALLPPNGDRFHLAAVSNFAKARQGAPSVPTLLDALGLVQETLLGVEEDSFPWLRLQWLAGDLLRSPDLQRFKEALAAYEIAQKGIEQRGDPFDRALLIVDLAELHLDRGVPEDARDLARHSFAVLGDLRNWPEAYRALRTFYRAANDLKLERSLLDTVRQRLLSARR
ncbi:MAG: hypothetical protein GY719_35685 [bacterium]|nr:hypothetical protein [bacterium]